MRCWGIGLVWWKRFFFLWIWCGCCCVFVGGGIWMLFCRWFCLCWSLLWWWRFGWGFWGLFLRCLFWVCWFSCEGGSCLGWGGWWGFGLFGGIGLFWWGMGCCSLWGWRWFECSWMFGLELGWEIGREVIYIFSKMFLFGLVM